MIVIIDNILSEKTCQQLISLASENLTDATTLGKDIPNYRTAKSTWLTQTDLAVEQVKHFASLYTSRPITHQEHVHIVKYDIGQEYKTHHDFFHPNTDYYDSAIAVGGQRTHTCLFYLNDDYHGGNTHFPQKNLIITPKIGRFLMWTNMYSNLTLDYDSLHAGLPVTEGEKWICVVWVRERAFNPDSLLT